MNWLKTNNPEIDSDRLQKTIEDEIEKIRSDPKFSPFEEKFKKTLSFETPQTPEALIEIAEAFTAGWDVSTLARRRPILKPFLPLLKKFLKKFFKPQYVFNSLILEIARNQETRIRNLEILNQINTERSTGSKGKKL